jgi:hypothetical protein
MMRNVALFLIVSVLSVSGIPAAWAQTDASQSQGAAVQSNPIGKVVTAKGSVTITHTDAVIVQANVSPDGGLGQAKVGDAVYQGDTVQTEADSAVGIVFMDGTAFNLYAKSRMVLDEFVYNPKGKSNSTLFSVARGSFTFITGKVAATGNMKVNTPVATMGIRGTSPHVEILENGTVKFSTLIEEGQEAQKRQSSDTLRPDLSSTDQANKDLNKRLRICRGC